MILTKEEYKRRWNEGERLTYEDVFDVAKAWGLFDVPESVPAVVLIRAVNGAAGIEDKPQRRAFQAKLAFEDWRRKDGRSEYSTEKGLRLSAGDLHSGTTFNAKIEDMDAEDAERIREAGRQGVYPVFRVILVWEDEN